MKVSVIIPAHNEEENLPILLEKTIRVVRGGDIIVVNDGSTDRTGDVAEKFASKKVRVINHPKNLGMSQALVTGLKNARYEWVVFMNADLQYDPKDIIKLMEDKEKYDIISGWRTERKDSFFRILVSKIFRKVIHLFFGVKLLDPNSGLKVMKKRVALELFSKMSRLRRPHRLMLVVATKSGYSVAEKPVKHFPRKYGMSYMGFREFFITILDLVTLGMTDLT